MGVMHTSTSRVQMDHSSWQAVIGCTAWALLISSAEASEMPRYFTLPSPTNACSQDPVAVCCNSPEA